MLLLLFLIGFCVSGIRLEPLDVNFGPEQDINFSPTMMNNNGIWDIHPEANVGPLSIGAQKNIEISPTFIKNNHPELWLQSPELIAGAPYHGVQKDIQLSTYLKKDFPGIFIQKTELSDKHQNQEIPFYVESQKEIELAEIHLKENLLSMSGAIPYLIDPRRGFAEIISVIYGIAVEIGYQCSSINYEHSYQKFINKIAVDGLSQPQIVVDDVKLGLAKFHHVIMPIQSLIKSVCPDHSNARYCDYMIHEIVVRQPEKYQSASKVFFAGYKTAHEFNNKMKEFVTVSKCHGAHKMIIEAPAVVKPAVYALANVVRMMVPLRNSCYSNV